MDLFFLLSVIIGLCVGSFLNVCIYRIPRRLSVNFPASHCTACKSPIKWYDNVPIVGWVVLRGKGRCCKGSISVKYPIVELLGGILGAVTFLTTVSLVGWVLQFSLFACLIALTFIDLEHLEIPDLFSYGVLGLGIIAQVLTNFYGLPVVRIGAWEGVLGWALATACLTWLIFGMDTFFNKEGMGFGDVKLLAAMGIWVGWQGVLFTFFSASVIGLLMISFLRHTKVSAQVEEGHMKTAAGSNPVENENENSSGHIPFGPSLVIAFTLYYFLAADWFNQLVANYVLLFQRIG